VVGMVSVLTGVDGVVHGGTASASVDSELRFFSAWYVCVGVLLLRCARAVETKGTIIQVISAGLF
jgi:hypothetical protein